jgi:hypothetical protein
MIDKGSRRWQYSTDTLYMGGKRIKEVYVGNKKVYPVGVNMMQLRDIIEDDAKHYGDAGGKKYNWYVQFQDGYTYASFGSGDRTLDARIFCDYHAPHNGKYYGKDFTNPVGFANYGDSDKIEVGGQIIAIKPKMRWIWFTAQTSEKTQRYYESTRGGLSYPVNPKWGQGRTSPGGPYSTNGDGSIWFGWRWWMYEDTRHIYKYDFVKREFGPELTGADLWVPVDPYRPDD